MVTGFNDKSGEAAALKARVLAALREGGAALLEEVPEPPQPQARRAGWLEHKLTHSLGHRPPTDSHSLCLVRVLSIGPVPLFPNPAPVPLLPSRSSLTVQAVASAVRRQSAGARQLALQPAVTAVVSDRKVRTPKYIYAAIRGLPIVKPEWVLACAKARRQVRRSECVPLHICTGVHGVCAALPPATDRPLCHICCPVCLVRTSRPPCHAARSMPNSWLPPCATPACTQLPMRPKQHLLRAPVTAPGGGTAPGLFAGLSVCVALPRHQLAKAGPMGDLLRHAGEAFGWWPGAWLRPSVCGLLYRAVVGLVRGAGGVMGPVPSN